MWTLHQECWEDLNKQLEEADGKIKIVIDLIIFELVIMAFYVYAISINFQSFPYEIRCVRPLK